MISWVPRSRAVPLVLLAALAVASYMFDKIRHPTMTRRDGASRGGIGK